MENVVERILIGVIFLMLIVLFWMWFCFGNCVNNWQKTRNPQERRMYAGARRRPSSFAPQEPTIYVSPANLPPPPKYDCIAPPSYEEVVGIHVYPQLQQPITQPITTAMGQSENRNNATSSDNASPSTVVTVNSNDRRTSVIVATSS